MLKHLSTKQSLLYNEFIGFVKENIVPFANTWDLERQIPKEVISLCGKQGYLGSLIPEENGGKGWDTITFGLLNEAFGSASSSVTGLITVQSMVTMTILKWGTPEQCGRWLTPLAKGEIIGSYALTEPNTGSDIQAIETSIVPLGENFLLKGTKKWISFGGIADLFLVFCKCEGKSAACIVERNTPGLKVNQIMNMSGFKSSHLAIVEFDNCLISKDNLIGKIGTGLQYVAPYGLHYGRLSTAWSSAGLLRACLEACSVYTSERKSFNSKLIDQQLIKSVIADMGVNLEASYLLCLNASKYSDENLPEAMEKALIAKYFTSRTAVRSATDAVQIFGASGCTEDSPVARYYRDAKIMEIIEGTYQMQQIILGKSFCNKFKR